MKFHVEYDLSELDAVKRVIKENPAVWRYQRNISQNIPDSDDEDLWMVHIRCLLTTQQKSGADSPINKFLEINPFPLSLNACRQSSNLYDLTLRLLTDARGIRRTKKIAKAVQKNFVQLEQGEWEKLRQWRDKLLIQRQSEPQISHRDLEEAASNYMDQFLEFGPKQSRNFWQLLGLTRYVFVLDSRVINWLSKHIEFPRGFLTYKGLTDNDYYRFISDILLDLCIQAEVLPCMFDAAAFDSKEKRL